MWGTFLQMQIIIRTTDILVQFITITLNNFKLMEDTCLNSIIITMIMMKFLLINLVKVLTPLFKLDKSLQHFSLLFVHLLCASFVASFGGEEFTIVGQYMEM